MPLKSRYEILKDFFFYYGCIWSVIYALQIMSHITGKKIPYSDMVENPYSFFAALLFVLILQPYFNEWARPKTIADYFPNADKEPQWTIKK